MLHTRCIYAQHGACTHAHACALKTAICIDRIVTSVQICIIADKYVHAVSLVKHKCNTAVHATAHFNTLLQHCCPSSGC